MKKSIQTNKAPKAIGPYSQAVKAGSLLFLSGQIPLDPETGQIKGSDVGAQTEQVMHNLKAVLAEAGLDFRHVLKVTVYLKRMEDFAAFNSIYESFLENPYPARATIEVSKLPKDALIEIDAIACESGI